MSRNSQLVADRRRKLKSMIVTYMGGKCIRCGWNEHQVSLVPHHVNESKKLFSLGNDGITRSWKNIQEECKKCMLLCMNCHGIIHALRDPYYFDELNIPDYGDFFDESGHNGRSIFYCIDCNKECSTKASRCKFCSGKFNATRPQKYVINWPILEIVKDLVEIHGYTGAGHILGVTDNAVKKHIKTHSSVL